MSVITKTASRVFCGNIKNMRLIQKDDSFDWRRMTYSGPT